MKEKGEEITSIIILSLCELPSFSNIFVCLCLCFSSSLFVCLFVYLFVCLFVPLLICLFVYLFVHVWALLLQQHLCLFVCAFACFFVCSFVDLSVCLFICPRVSSQHLCPPSCCASAKLKQPKTTKHRVWNTENVNWNKEKGKFQCLFWLFDNRLASALHGAYCH